MSCRATIGDKAEGSIDFGSWSMMLDVDGCSRFGLGFVMELHYTPVVTFYIFFLEQLSGTLAIS